MPLINKCNPLHKYITTVFSYVFELLSQMINLPNIPTILRSTFKLIRGIL